jgi:hypothetical protein
MWSDRVCRRKGASSLNQGSFVQVAWLEGSLKVARG